MLRLSRSTLLLLILALAGAPKVSAQDTHDLPLPEAPPHPQCDSYSLQTLPRLNFKQQACVYRSQLLTGNAISGALVSSAIAEWGQHKPPEWPQGMNGFGRQIGTHYTQSIVKSTGTFLVGALLQEDPRPLPPVDPVCEMRGHHHYPAVGFWPRLGQSLARVVWTHNRNCHDVPAFSRLTGSVSSGFVQLAWLPPSQTNVGTALRGSATALGGYTFNSVFNEFQSKIFGFLGKAFATGKPAKPSAAGSSNVHGASNQSRGDTKP